MLTNRDRLRRAQKEQKEGITVPLSQAEEVKLCLELGKALAGTGGDKRLAAQETLPPCSETHLIFLSLAMRSPSHIHRIALAPPACRGLLVVHCSSSACRHVPLLLIFFDDRRCGMSNTSPYTLSPKLQWRAHYWSFRQSGLICSSM